MEKKSIEISKLFRAAREQLIDTIVGMVGDTPDKEIDLIEAGGRVTIYTNYGTIDCEVLGVSTCEDDHETYLAVKYIGNDGEEIYRSVPVGELNNDDLLDLLRLMEDATDSE